MFRRRNYYVALLAAALVYVIGTWLAPLGPNRFNLTPAKTHLLQLTITLPVVFIWLAAVYGAERFKSYADSIKNYKDGQALNRFADGLALLVAGIILNGLYGVLRPWARQDGWLSPFTITANYLAMVIPLIAFWLMYTASRDFRKVNSKNSNTQSWIVVIGLIMLAVGVFYIRSIFNYPYINSTPDPSRYSSFYMSDVMVVLTLGIPYLISWGLGLVAALNLATYRRDVKGVLYKGALFRIVLGTVMVVVFSIIVQMFIAFSTYIAKAGLSSILLIVYLLLLLYAAGFLIIASGARRLAAIEKVK